jgi:hypothetical protein
MREDTARSHSAQDELLAINYMERNGLPVIEIRDEWAKQLYDIFTTVPVGQEY